MVLAVTGAPLSQGEKDFAMSSLHSSRKQFLDAVANLTAAQAAFQGPGGQSIAEIAEHVAASETYLSGLVRKMGTGAAASEEMQAETKGRDSAVPKTLAEAEPAGLPKAAAKPRPVKASVAAFKTTREQFIAYIDTSKESFRDKAADQPPAGPVDGYQMMLFTAVHTEKHVREILAVKADPKFPKK